MCYPDWLKKGGNGTFFLFKAGNEFFVAAVYLFSDGRLGARVRRFTLDRVFGKEASSAGAKIMWITLRAHLQSAHRTLREHIRV